ncbi:MAG: hypothetical protein GY757_01120, partial [bacterium]|nr:hypothetical protein [bacterium]
TKGGIDTFLEFWQQCTGTIDVKAIEGTPAKADEKRGNSPVTYAILIDRDDLPFYYFVRWFQKEKEWTLYYLERDKEKREQWEHRIYCPWEYELEGTVEHEQRGILAMDERFYPLKEKEEFRNLFELLDVRPTLGRPGNPVKNINITNPPIEEREPFDLNIRLVSKTGISQNAQIDLKRIDEKIEDLEELKLIIEFQKEQSAKLVRLKIYPETKVDETGSSRELKQWFKRAPDEQLQRYCHTRIVAELGGKEQALHLVFPKGMGEEPRTSLPPSRYTLHLDNYWSKKGHNLFTPRNLCVYPSPPVPNTRIDEIIAGCLFKGITKKELLVLMRHGEEDYRFAIKPTCLEPPKYRTLSTLYPLEFFTAHKIMTRRNDKFYLDMDRYKTLTGEEKKELL